MKQFNSNLQDAIEDVIKELIEIKPDLCALSFDTLLDADLVQKFCEKFNLSPDKDFLKNMLTPFSIAKYLILTIEEETLISEIEPILTDTFKNTDILFTFEKKFSNCIIFSKIANIDRGIKSEDLRIKFYKDTETEKFKYHIVSGFWGLDLELNQLVSLLLRKQIQTINEPKVKNNKTDFKVLIDDVEICVRKVK